MAVEQDGTTGSMNWRMEVSSLLQRLATEFEEVEVGKQKETEE